MNIDPLALPSLPLERRSELPDSPGIYFVIASDGSVLYIGKTRRLATRWKSTYHHRYAQIAAIPGVRLAWLSVSDESLLFGIESACIEYFAPALNRAPVEAVRRQAMTDSDGERRIGLMVRLPPDLHAEVVQMSKGGTARPATSLNNTVVFLLRAGVAAIKRAEQSEKEPGPEVPELLAAA